MMLRRILFLLPIIIVAVGISACRVRGDQANLASVPGNGSPETGNFLDLNPQTFPDIFQNFGLCRDRVRYQKSMAVPSRWFTDAYGLHVMRPVTEKDVEHDFVEKGLATLVQAADGTLHISIDDRFQLIFYFDRALRVNGFVDVGHSYVYFKTTVMDDLIAGLERFHEILASQSLEDKYLLPNANYQMERQVQARWTAPKPAALIDSDPEAAKFSRSKDSILVVGDPVHGDQKRYDELTRLLSTQDLSWFGIEMFPKAHQADLNSFLNAPETSDEFKNARQVVLEKVWHGYFPHDPAHPEENHYFKLIEIARQRHIAVYGLDIDVTVTLWTHGESAFGTSVRSLHWAEAMTTAIRADGSATQKGLVFGGSGHFDNQVAVNVQDFLRDVHPKTKMYLFGTVQTRDFFSCAGLP